MLNFYFKDNIKLLNVSATTPNETTVHNVMLDLLKGATLTKRERKLLGLK
jgi:hypothetical protein